MTNWDGNYEVVSLTGSGGPYAVRGPTPDMKSRQYVARYIPYKWLAWCIADALNRPALHEKDEKGNWICCCGDHLECKSDKERDVMVPYDSGTQGPTQSSATPCSGGRYLEFSRSGEKEKDDE